MSAWLKLKALAGGSLSLKVDDTLATDETFDISKGGIEYGSNANGEYTKFPDGTLICTGNTGNSEEVRTFPHPFIVEPQITFGMFATVTTNVYLVNTKSLTATTFSAFKLFHAKTASSVSWGVSGQSARYIAIGRWK